VTRSDRWVGIDVRSDRLNAVGLRDASSSDAAGRKLVVDSVHRGGLEHSGLLAFCDGAVKVAVDAPGGPSHGAHAGDLSIAPKFRVGRCSEVPVAGWPAVSWVTPEDPALAPGWIRSGFELWSALESAGLQVIETFPAAVFHRLNGRRWPPSKSTPAGRHARRSLLAPLIDLPPDAEGWSHDDLDAAAAGLVAAVGSPALHACEHPDGSALWLLEAP
jgi:hypothetical protein